MKFLLFTFFIIFSSHSFASQEIQRIDSMVHDIEQLRQNYEKRITELQEQNSIYEKKISSLENQIDILKNSKKSNKKIEKIKVVVEKEVCKDENKFPNLKLKHQKEHLIHFEASAFRFKDDAPIYADLNSNVIVDKWEKGTSFTSNLKSEKRIKITGYFVDKTWKKAEKNMWVDLDDVVKR